MPATISIILDTRRVKKNDRYPVKLRVTFERITGYYQTVYDLSHEEFNKLSASRISGELQNIRSHLRDIERDAENLIRELDPFTFCRFEIAFVRQHQLFRQKKLKPDIVVERNSDFDYLPFHKKFPILLDDPGKPGSIGVSYLGYIKKLLREGRIGTASNYHCSYVSLKKFNGNVQFREITVSFLYEFESWLKSQNISRTTIGMYIRPLRAIFNEAIEAGIIKREKCYPFGRRKYTIPTAKNTKKALDLEDIEQIYYYQSEPGLEAEQRARDYWLFSYFGNGMNTKDIAFLKYKNIDGNFLVFERIKTDRALRSDPKPITVFINEDMHAIIERWGNKDKSRHNFIFPILQPGLSPLRQYELLQLFVAFINDWMKRILKKLGIDKIATTYVARHTFSTVLKRSGASTDFIREALGHSDVKTTENYLDSFDKGVKKEFAQMLTSFKRKPSQQPFEEPTPKDEKG